MTKPNEQHQFDLVDMRHNFFKGTRTSISYLALMLHQDVWSPDPLRPIIKRGCICVGSNL